MQLVHSDCNDEKNFNCCSIVLFGIGASCSFLLMGFHLLCLRKLVAKQVEWSTSGTNGSLNQRLSPMMREREGIKMTEKDIQGIIANSWRHKMQMKKKGSNSSGRGWTREGMMGIQRDKETSKPGRGTRWRHMKTVGSVGLLWRCCRHYSRNPLIHPAQRIWSCSLCGRATLSCQEKSGVEKRFLRVIALTTGS